MQKFNCLNFSGFKTVYFKKRKFLYQRKYYRLAYMQIIHFEYQKLFGKTSVILVRRFFLFVQNSFKTVQNSSKIAVKCVSERTYSQPNCECSYSNVSNRMQKFNCLNFSGFKTVYFKKRKFLYQRKYYRLAYMQIIHFEYQKLVGKTSVILVRRFFLFVQNSFKTVQNSSKIAVKCVSERTYSQPNCECSYSNVSNRMQKFNCLNFSGFKIVYFKKRKFLYQRKYYRLAYMQIIHFEYQKLFGKTSVILVRRFFLFVQNSFKTVQNSSKIAVKCVSERTYSQPNCECSYSNVSNRMQKFNCLNFSGFKIVYFKKRKFLYQRKYYRLAYMQIIHFEYQKLFGKTSVILVRRFFLFVQNSFKTVQNSSKIAVKCVSERTYSQPNCECSYSNVSNRMQKFNCLNFSGFKIVYFKKRKFLFIID